MAAAAAASSRSRAAAGARTTGDLFFIFTLLSLLCLAHSYSTNIDLEKLKETIKKSEKDLAFLKATMERPSEMMDVYMNLMDPLSGLMKKTSSKLPKGFPPLDELMHGFKDFMHKVKVYMDDQREEVINNIESKEEEVRKMKRSIQFLEDLQAALKLPKEDRKKTIESVIAKFKKVNPAIRFTVEDKDV